MNMTKGLLHRSHTAAADGALHTTPDSGPPPAHPPGTDSGDPWPMRARVLVALLVMATVLGTVGTVFGFTSGDDGATERTLRDQVASLTKERDDSLDAVDELDAELVTLRQRLRAAQDGNDDLIARTAELEDQIAALTAQRDAAKDTAASLEVELATMQQRLTNTIAERDALAALFPMTFDVPFGTPVVIGDYDVGLSEIDCSGLTWCGKAPLLADLSIRTTPEGTLRFTIPGFAEGGLAFADGAFLTVVDSNTAIPACAGTPRTARVTMTMFPGLLEIARDSVPEVINMKAVFTVEAAATGSCPAAQAFYSAELAPHA